MSIVWSAVVAIAPALSATPAATQTAILAAVDRQIDDTAWGIYADDGRAYLAAHLAGISSGRGFVTSETLGAMSRSYAMPPGVYDSLGLSAFGMEYLRLMRLANAFSATVP